MKKKIKQAEKKLGLTLKLEQREPIHRILESKDTMVIYPVGFGKSAIMEIPAIIKPPVLVFEPTISLMYDQVQGLKAKGIRAEYISSSHTKKERTAILDDYVHGKIDILYAAPERLQYSKFLKAIFDNPPWLVTVDEAHCAIEWGRTFRSDYLDIGKFIDRFNDRPTVLAMTATAPSEYRQELQESLHMRDIEIYSVPLDRPNLYIIREYMQLKRPESRIRHIKTLIERYGNSGKTIVYCATKGDTDKVRNYLNEQYPGEVAECHSFMDKKARQENEMKFIQNDCHVMVATTSFGMGVDVPDIRLVIHYSMPISPISYYQEIGRAGRDGKKSRCVLLYHPDDEKKFKKILDKEKEKHGKEARDRLKKGISDMKEIAEGDRCIMEAVLEHLGDTQRRSCGHCSVCQMKKAKQGRMLSDE